MTHDPRRIRQDPLVREAMYGFIFQMAFDYAYLPPSGRTALHGAAQKGWNDMIRLLVEHGAEVQPVVKSRFRILVRRAVSEAPPGVHQTTAIALSFRSPAGPYQVWGV